MSVRRRIFITTAIAVSATLASVSVAVAEEIYGPVNLLKTMKTPFGSSTGDQESGTNGGLAPLSLHSTATRSLSNRLLPPRLYLPGRMVIGSTAEFIIKGRAGSRVALAMADKNSGAKPIYGRSLHLGPDRKLVAIGQIPEGGVLSLVVETPIEGDLIGLPLFFEAAIWSRPDFSDVELATPVPSESTPLAPSEYSNGVILAAEADHKRGVRLVPDAQLQMQQVQGKAGIDSGRP